MKLLRDKSSNKFCGPAALALLTGKHVDDATRTLRAVTGKRAIKGVRNHHMIQALDKLGQNIMFVPPNATPKKPPTLAQALRGTLKERKPDQRYLMVVTGHYVVIEGRKLYDNKHPEGVYLGQCPYRRKRVRAIWSITPAPAPPKWVYEPPPMTFPCFVDALAALRLDTDGQYVDAPFGFRFQSGLHCIAITGTYEEALVAAKHDLPLVACRPKCDCFY